MHNRKCTMARFDHVGYSDKEGYHSTCACRSCELDLLQVSVVTFQHSPAQIDSFFQLGLDSFNPGIDLQPLIGRTHVAEAQSVLPLERMQGRLDPQLELLRLLDLLQVVAPLMSLIVRISSPGHPSTTTSCCCSCCLVCHHKVKLHRVTVS